MELITRLFATGRSLCARSAPARASGLVTGNEGRACISSIAMLLFGSSFACIHTTPIASSSRAFDSADIEGRTRVECEPGLVGFVWAGAAERQTNTNATVAKTFFIIGV